MNEVITMLSTGFSNLLSFPAVIAMIGGVILGTIFGALPGLSATTGMALLLPVAYSLDLKISLLMLAGIYCGALYGGSISAILLGIPGTAAALPTTFDGYPMARQGHANKALLAGLYASSIGGVASALVMMFLTPAIASVAVKFGTAEMFLLGVWGLSMVTGVVGGDVIKGLFMATLGLLVGMVGPDPINGISRFSFGQVSLIGGFPLVPAILGTMALPRVYEMIETFRNDESFFSPQKEKSFFLKPIEILKHWFLLLRSTIVGVVVGIAPAAGPAIAAMLSYNLAVKNDKNPETFGEGRIEGVYAAEAANNGATGGSLVFALSLGIPGSAAAAVLMSALIMKGIQPGPMLMTNNSDLVYTFFAGFLVVNILVFVIGHGFVQIGGYVLNTPVKLLAPVIFVICMVGAYSDSRMTGVIQAFAISIIAYILSKLKFPMAPFLLALILVEIMEKNLWSYYAISQGNLEKAFTRPVFLLLLVLVALTFALPLITKIIRKQRLKI